MYVVRIGLPWPFVESGRSLTQTTLYRFEKYFSSRSSAISSSPNISSNGIDLLAFIGPLATYGVAAPHLLALCSIRAAGSFSHAYTRARRRWQDRCACLGPRGN